MKRKKAFDLSDFQKTRQRRQFIARLGLFAVGLVLVLGGSAWFLARASLFRIDAIKVYGSGRIPSEEYTEAFKRYLAAQWSPRSVFGAGSILGWPNSFSKNILGFFPVAKNIVLRKNYREHAIEIEIEEREPYGMWCARISESEEAPPEVLGERGVPEEHSVSPTCFWFDREGVLFDHAIPAEGSLLTVVDDYRGEKLGLGSTILPDRFLANAFSILDVLSESRVNVKHIKLTDLRLQEVQVETHDGPALYFSLRFPAEPSRAAMEKIFSETQIKTLRYIDFRVPNRVYYQ